MENDAPSNQRTKCPEPSTSGLVETPASSTQTAMLSGGLEMESNNLAFLPSHARACANASSMLGLFCSARDILAFLQSMSPDVVEAYREFLQFSERGEVFAITLPKKLRTLADEFDRLSKT